MAITNKEQGVWNVDQVYNKINEGDIWSYTGDPQLWGWGQNFQGYLGQNDQNSRSSPIQIGTGESWELTRTKSYFAGAMGLIEQA